MRRSTETAAANAAAIRAVLPENHHPPLRGSAAEDAVARETGAATAYAARTAGLGQVLRAGPWTSLAMATRYTTARYVYQGGTA